MAGLLRASWLHKTSHALGRAVERAKRATPLSLSLSLHAFKVMIDPTDSYLSNESHQAGWLSCRSSLLDVLTKLQLQSESSFLSQCPLPTVGWPCLESCRAIRSLFAS